MAAGEGWVVMNFRPVDPDIARGILASFATIPEPTAPLPGAPRGPVRTRVINRRQYAEVPEIAALLVGESVLLSGPHPPRHRIKRAKRLAPASEFLLTRKSQQSWIVERIA